MYHLRVEAVPSAVRQLRDFGQHQMFRVEENLLNVPQGHRGRRGVNDHVNAVFSANCEDNSRAWAGSAVRDSYRWSPRER